MSGRGKLGRAASCITLAVAAGCFVTSVSGARAGDRHAEAARHAAARPNILFILIDDMGLGDLSIMGNRRARTPNLDRVAREGLLLTHFYDPAPVCSASRAGFLTGRFPAALGFVTFLHTRQSNADQGQVNWLDPGLPNYARMIKSAGYVTAHYGKWHLGGGRDIGEAPWPTAYGFDDSFTTFEGLGPRVLQIDQPSNLSKMSATLGQGPVQWSLKADLTGLYVDKTIAFIGRHRDHPWFVNLWLDDVHDPHLPDAEDAETHAGSGRDVKEDRFFAVLERMDTTLGKLLAALDRMHETKDTLVVITSDNGPTARPAYYGDGGQAPGSTLGLRGRKWSLYEGGIRMPLIVRWPGHVAPGWRDGTTVGSGVDLLPTLAHAIGQPVPDGGEGIDLASAFTGKPIVERPPLFWAVGKHGAREGPTVPFELHDRSPHYAVRDGRWKLLANFDGSGIELYDLDRDPAESQNVAEAHPDIRDRLWTELNNWLAKLH